MMAFLVGNCGLSKRRVEEVVEAVFEVPVAVGTVAKLEQQMSAALEPAHQQALAAVQAAPVKHLDETGWKKAGHKRWLWVAATLQEAVGRRQWAGRRQGQTEECALPRAVAGLRPSCHRP